MEERFAQDYELRPPTQKQVQGFARECILFAHRHEQLRHPQSQKYRTKPISHFRAADVANGEPLGFIYKDTYSAFVDLNDGKPSHLKVIHGLVVEDMGSNSGVLRQIYSFSPGENGEAVARRRHSFGHVSYTKLEDMNLDNLRLPADIADHFAVENEFATITAGDFRILTQSMRALMSRVDSGELAYSEQRKNRFTDYFDND